MRNWITQLLAVVFACTFATTALAAEPMSVPDVVGQFCVGCHEGKSAKGNLDLAAVVSDDVTRHAQDWEKVVRRLRGRQMPPAGRKRPDEATYESVLSQLETALDRA